MIEPVDVPLDHSEIQQSINYISSIDPELFADEIQTIQHGVAQGQLHPEAWRLVWRTRCFNWLDRHGLPVVDEHGDGLSMTWRDILRDYSGFLDSIMFELEVAAVLTASEVDIAFIQGSGEARAPDLLVGDDLWIECKMRQLEEAARKWDRIKDEILNEVISPATKMDNTIHAFTISFSGTLEQDDIAALSETLLEMIKRGETTRQHEQYTVNRSEQSVSLSELDESLSVGHNFQTDPHGRKTEISVYVDENGDISEFVGAEIQFDFEDQWYYPKKIRNRVKEATGKNLSDKKKSAVVVGVPPAYLNEMVGRATPVEHRSPDSQSEAISQFKRLDEEIRYRILNQSQTLNIVCLYFSGILNNIAYCPLIRYWENEECRHPDHDNLYDALTDIHRTYAGYLRAKEVD